MHKACGLLRSGGLVAALLAATIIPAAAKPDTSTPTRLAPTVSAAQDQVLRATGAGAMPSASEEPNRARAYLKAKSQAKMEAIANLIQAARGTMIRYRSSSKGSVCEEEIKQEIEGMLEGVIVVSERKRQEGKDTIVEVTVEGPKPGGLREAPATLAAGPTEEPVRIASTKLDQSWIRAKPRMKTAPAKLLTANRPKDAAYSSVIINVRGFNVKRSMAPKIVRDDGSEVWGTLKVDYDFVADHGIVAYVRSLAEAFGNDRAGDNPLVIRGIGRGTDPYGGDAVISDEDADYLLAENKRSEFLGAFHVIFVIDESKF